MVLPFKITFYLFLSIVILVTIFKPFFNWSRTKSFVISFFMTIVLFIPSCTGIQIIVDNYRFGEFKYNDYTEIKDLRIKYNLPQKATEITIYKSNPIYYAKYKISKVDLDLYVDSLWIDENQSLSIRDKADKIVIKDNFNYQFKDTSWSVAQNIIILDGPISSNGAGSTYYFDHINNMAYQYTCYW